jgi:predicted secreted protein
MNNFMRLLFLAGCLFVQYPVVAQTYVATEEQRGGVVSMSVGDTLEVILHANPTTGYCWTPTAPISQWLILTGHKHEPSSSMPGAPGLSTFSFVAISPGDCDLTMVYARPWENTPPLETYTVSVHIDPKE